MGPNSELRRRLNKFRRRLYRSEHGQVLGVFSGIAASLGFCTFWTRVIGGIVLLSVAGAAGAKGLPVTLLVAGFFYLLLALLMQPPRVHGEAGGAGADDEGAPPLPATTPFWRRDRPADAPPYHRERPVAVPSYRATRPVPRVDLHQLDQQLDRLDERIQRMESVVTDRQYDWDRRLEK